MCLVKGMTTPVAFSELVDIYVNNYPECCKYPKTSEAYREYAMACVNILNKVEQDFGVQVVYAINQRIGSSTLILDVSQLRRLITYVGDLDNMVLYFIKY